MIDKAVFVKDLGTLPYKECWDLQENYNHRSVSQKLYNFKNKRPVSADVKNHLFLVEHPPVFTLGKSGSFENLLLSTKDLEEKGIEYFKINRGGDITFHGPGQIVMYPIIDLEQFFTDIHKYLRYLEEAVISTLKDFGIEAGRYEGYTGVWIDADKPNARKICAMGIRCSRWITMHGIALNVNTNLDYFNHIVPCGIEDKAVTSMAFELQKNLNIDDVKKRLLWHTAQLFGMDLKDWD